MKTFFLKRGEKTDKESSEFLHINHCGVALATHSVYKGVARILRPEGRNDYQILLFLEGIVEVNINGEIQTLKPYDCVIFPPFVPQDYTFRTCETVRQSLGYFVHFTGTAADELMATAGLAELCILRSVSGDTKRIFESMKHCFVKKDNIAALGYLLRLVSLLSQKADSNVSESHRLVKIEAEHINLHYAEDIDFDAMAARCNLSRSRFTHVFSDLFGQPPTQYQMRLKLEQAQELLRYSTLTVGEIASQCGFHDALYFSRVFSKAFGVSPSRFREDV